MGTKSKYDPSTNKDRKDINKRLGHMEETIAKLIVVTNETCGKLEARIKELEEINKSLDLGGEGGE